MLVVKSLLDCARLCAIIVNCTTFNCRMETCALVDIHGGDRVLDKHLRCFTKITEGGSHAMPPFTRASIRSSSFTSCRGSLSSFQPGSRHPISPTSKSFTLPWTSTISSYQTFPSESSIIIPSTNTTSLSSSNRMSSTTVASAPNSRDNAQAPFGKIYTTIRSRVTSLMNSTTSMSTMYTTITSISSPTPSISSATEATTTTVSLTVDTTTTTAYTDVASATGSTNIATTSSTPVSSATAATNTATAASTPVASAIAATNTDSATAATNTDSATAAINTAKTASTPVVSAIESTKTATTASTSVASATDSTKTVTAEDVSGSNAGHTTTTATSTNFENTHIDTSTTRFHAAVSTATITTTPASTTTTATTTMPSPFTVATVDTVGTTVAKPTPSKTAITTNEDHLPAGLLRMCEFGGTFYNGSCYVFCNSRESFSSARRNCHENSMRVIEDRSEEMNRFLVSFLSGKSKYYVWLSGTDEDGHWMWPESNEEFTYTNWGDDQPDNEGRYHQDAHCLALRTQNFKWDDLACNEESNYVCVFKWNGTTFPGISPDGKASLLNDCGNDGGKALNGWCYRFVHPPVIWESAKAYCEERHMRLLEIKSEKVQDFIDYFMKYINPTDYFCVWTALQESNRRWVWQGSLEQVNYTNWAKHHPDGTRSLIWTNKCVSMNKDGLLWHRVSCSASCQFICEYANITTTTVTPTTVKPLPPGQLRQCRFGGTFFLGKCYVLFNDPQTAETAKAKCHERQMTLYEDTTKEKSTFIAQFLKTRSNGLVWMAGSDDEVEGRWVWSESRLPVSYTRWGRRQPDNGKSTGTAENCLAWESVHSTWSDLECEEEADYLCEYRWAIDLPLYVFLAGAIGGAGWNGSTFAGTSPDGEVSLMDDCGQGGKEFLGRCYISAYPQVGWTEARVGMSARYFVTGRSAVNGSVLDHLPVRICKERNMKLVEIVSARDQQFLEYYIKYIRPSGYECIWIGLSDAKLEGHWVWKGSNEIPRYTNWAPGQPDHVDTFLLYGEDCAAMDNEDNKWHDKGCTSVMCDFMCEYTSSRTATTTTKPLSSGILRQCKLGGTFYKGHCHVYFSKMDTYDNAEKACHTKGMRVYEDTSKDKTEFLAQFLKAKTKNSVWLAGSDQNREGDWLWLESEQPFTYTHWADGEPDNDGAWLRAENCLVFNGEWDDVGCGSAAEYVCENTWTGATFDGNGDDMNLLGDCLNGGKFYRGSCYMYFNAGVSWNEAKKICDDRNMFLLEDTSEDEHRFVSYYLSFIHPEKGTCLWIGLSEIQVEGRWVWESSGKPVDYTHWNMNQPSGKAHFYSSDPDCVYLLMVSDNSWHDGVCSKECAFICEQRCDDVPHIKPSN